MAHAAGLRPSAVAGHRSWAAVTRAPEQGVGSGTRGTACATPQPLQQPQRAAQVKGLLAPHPLLIRAQCAPPAWGLHAHWVGGVQGAQGQGDDCLAAGYCPPDSLGGGMALTLHTPAPVVRAPCALPPHPVSDSRFKLLLCTERLRPAKTCSVRRAPKPVLLMLLALRVPAMAWQGPASHTQHVGWLGAKVLRGIYHF